MQFPDFRHFRFFTSRILRPRENPLNSRHPNVDDSVGVKRQTLAESAMFAN